MFMCVPHNYVISDQLITYKFCGAEFSLVHIVMCTAGVAGLCTYPGALHRLSHHCCIFMPYSNEEPSKPIKTACHHGVHQQHTTYTACIYIYHTTHHISPSLPHTPLTLQRGGRELNHGLQPPLISLPQAVTTRRCNSLHCSHDTLYASSS